MFPRDPAYPYEDDPAQRKPEQVSGLDAQRRREEEANDEAMLERQIHSAVEAFADDVWLRETTIGWTRGILRELDPDLFTPGPGVSK